MEIEIMTFLLTIRCKHLTVLCCMFQKILFLQMFFSEILDLNLLMSFLVISFFAGNLEKEVFFRDISVAFENLLRELIQIYIQNNERQKFYVSLC